MSIKRLKDKELKHVAAGGKPSRFLNVLMSLEGSDKGLFARTHHPGRAVAV